MRLHEKVHSGDLAIIHRDSMAGVIEMLDIKNRRVIKRRVYYVGAPKVAVVIYQGQYQWVCNMGKVERGEIRY